MSAPTDKLTWLHISDFHIRAGDPYDRNVVLGSLVRSVEERRKHHGHKPDLIFATGDIAQSGKASEYEHATAFFDALLGAAELERGQLFIVPGNHDVDRDRAIGLARTLGSREDSDAYFGPGIPKPHIGQKLAAFRDWYNEYFKDIRQLPDDTTCGPVEIAEVRGVRVAVLPLNTALFCQDDNDHSKLIIGRRCLQRALEDMGRLDAHLKVALAHHPLDWLSDFERGNIKASLQGTMDVMLRGHLHETEVESVVSPTGKTLHLAAGAAYQTRKWPNRALYSFYEKGSLRILPVRYEDSPTEIWTVDPSIFPNDDGFTRAFALARIMESVRTVVEAAARPRLEVTAPSRTMESSHLEALSEARETIKVPRFRSNIRSRGDLPFVERDQLLKEIENALGDPGKDSVLILHGPPGVGKSELAREFARKQLDRYPGGTFFVRTGGGAELLDLAQIGAKLLGLQFSADLSLRDQCERTFVSLGAAPVLLIYDNVVSLDVIEGWLPNSGMPCHVLITTLNERLSVELADLAVPPLSSEASLELITRVAGREVAEKHGDALVKLSGGLPIQIMPASLMLAYEARRGRLDRTALTISSEAQRSFLVVYETLDSAVRLLLHAAAFLNCDRIVRRELFRNLEGACNWDEAEFDQQLDVCIDFHLLEGVDELRMHQLFESFLCGVGIADDLKAELDRVRATQRERFVELGRSVGAKPADRELVLALLTYSLEVNVWEEAHVGLSVEDGEAVGYGLNEIGRFAEARPWYERAVKQREQLNAHGQLDHKRLGPSLHQVGYCLSSEGKFEEARAWYERAVAAKQQGDGPVDHASLSLSLHQIGICLSSVDKYEEAQPWFERAVAEIEQGDLQGRVDRSALGRSLHQVGVCLSSVGKLEKAQTWYERAVAERERGDLQGRVDHSGLGISLHQVGFCLSSGGKFEEARPWFERAVAEHQQGEVHGRVDHENLGRALHLTGFCLSRLEKFEEAQPWFEEAIAEKQQGDLHGRVDHSSLGLSMHQVGFCLSSLGKFGDAESWYERAVAEMRQGDRHGRVDFVNLSRSLGAVAYCLRKLGKAEEAQKWEQRASELPSTTKRSDE